MDLVPDFKAYYDVWIKPDEKFKILLDKKYADEKFYYKSQNTLSEDLEKLKNNKQSDLKDVKKQKKDQEKTLREVTKDIKKNEQDLDKINNDISKLNAGDLDYMKNNGFKLDENGSSEMWKQEQLEKLTNKKNSILYTISYNNSKKLSLEKNIGSLNYSIENLNSYIRNASSAMKTLTLGAY